MNPEPDIERMVEKEVESLRAGQPQKNRQAPATEFAVLGDDRYRLSVPAIGAVFEVDRLRRERNELFGELSVRCDLPGARTFDGSLSIADFNLSSARARSERARLLQERANTRSQVDWLGYVEEFCQRVLQADRAGQPAVDLRDIPYSAADATYTISSLTLPRIHPSILFGDGGTAKSYIALNFIGKLAENGTRVVLFDWELSDAEHRNRLGRLFPDGMPRILHARCDKPLVHEVDRLRRIVKDNRIEFCVFDSIAFACDGPPEAAEVAARYLRAVRQIGIGSLHIAHITKSEGGDKKPFGSVFWHNGARSTWFAQCDETTVGTDVLKVGLFHRKTNLGRLLSPVGLTIEFRETETIIKRSDIAASPGLAPNLTVHQRMYHLLRGGAMSTEQIAEEIGAKPDAIRKTVERHPGKFVLLEGGKKIGLQA